MACDYNLQLGEPILTSKIKSLSVCKMPFLLWSLKENWKERKEVNRDHWEAEIMESTDQTAGILRLEQLTFN